MDFENQDKEKDNSSTAGSFNGNSTNNSKGWLCSLSCLHLFCALRLCLFCPCVSAAWVVGSPGAPGVSSQHVPPHRALWCCLVRAPGS